MTEQEFLTQAIDYLVELFPEMAQRTQTPGQIRRWVKRFGHLDLSVWQKSVDTYHDDKHYPPTINGLMEYVPESHRTKSGKPKDASSYDRPGAYREFDATDPVAQIEDFRPNWAELYRQLNARDWGMEGESNATA